MTLSPKTKALLSSKPSYLPYEKINELEELTDCTGHDTEADFLQAIKDEKDLSEAVGEWADAQVSVYTYDRYEWAMRNIRKVQEHEEELLACGYKSIDDIFAVCWYRAEEESMNETLSAARKALAL